VHTRGGLLCPIQGYKSGKRYILFYMYIETLKNNFLIFFLQFFLIFLNFRKLIALKKIINVTKTINLSNLKFYNKLFYCCNTLVKTQENLYQFGTELGKKNEMSKTPGTNKEAVKCFQN
jgi:hypothetical protein